MDAKIYTEMDQYFSGKGGTPSPAHFHSIDETQNKP